VIQNTTINEMRKLWIMRT